MRDDHSSLSGSGGGPLLYDAAGRPLPPRDPSTPEPAASRPAELDATPAAPKRKRASRTAASRTRTPAHAESHGVSHVIESVHTALEGAGISIHGVGFLLTWWKKLGAAGAITLSLAVAIPAGGYAFLAYHAARAVPGWIGDFGVTFDAGEWDVHLLSMKSVARDVKIRRDDHSAPVLTASEIVFDGSVRTLFSSLFTRGGAFNEITIRHGEIQVERSLTGDFNWVDFLAAVPKDRRDAAVAGLYSIHALRLDDVRLVYVEHVPGGSGGGVVRTAEARVIFDNITGEILDLTRPKPGVDRPTAFAVKARLADGVVEMKGEAGVFPESVAATTRAASLITQPSATPASTAAAANAGGPSFSMRVYLENIGMGAYGQMVSTTQILPTSGTLHGTVQVEKVGEKFACLCNLSMDSVGFAANPQVIPAKADVDALNRSLAGYRKSGTFNVCGANDEIRRDPRDSQATMSAMMAQFNAQATATAPSNVRVAALRDQHAIAGVVTNALLDDLTQEQATDNALAKGVKSVGRGLKKLFGGR